jgi:hypothetical protein
VGDEFFDEIEIKYAYEHREADDLIETIIRRHPQPKQLTVVSSDHRLQRCAHARRAAAIDSDVWLLQLEQGHCLSSRASLPSPQQDDEKPTATAEHVESLLRKLGYAPSSSGLAHVSSTDTDSDLKPVHDQHSREKQGRHRGRSREDRQRANRPIDSEVPQWDIRSFED